MFWSWLLGYIIFLSVYAFFFASIVWHIREYSMPGDSSKRLIGFFMVLTIIFALLSLFLFFRLPLA